MIYLLFSSLGNIIESACEKPTQQTPRIIVLDSTHAQILCAPFQEGTATSRMAYSFTRMTQTAYGRNLPVLHYKHAGFCIGHLLLPALAPYNRGKGRNQFHPTFCTSLNNLNIYNPASKKYCAFKSLCCKWHWLYYWLIKRFTKKYNCKHAMYWLVQHWADFYTCLPWHFSEPLLINPWTQSLSSVAWNASQIT